VTGEDRLYADLAALDIAHNVAEHEAVFTVAESEQLHRDLPGAHTKNLFLKDAGGAFWLVTVPADARVDLKALPAAIGSKRVSFGKADDMERLLGITPGSVTPLAAINAPPGSINVVLAEPLAAADPVHVHPLRNTATVGLAGQAILHLLGHWGHAPIIASIPTLETP
jgi:Ala-tRNA(Pro) deacylase